ncbi:hypothetical protein OBV_27230 [Oscillibacter valericigenes Sjm18-20]|nr:hypothetical protein OBV_27230 [Oscillibacter valericigenes Sjm18-20]
MSSAVIKTECNDSKVSIAELSEILKSRIDAELDYESTRTLGETTLSLLSFERYYSRCSSHANLIVLLTETSHIQAAEVIGCGGGYELFNLSLSDNKSFAKMAVEILKKFGYTEKV